MRFETSEYRETFHLLFGQIKILIILFTMDSSDQYLNLIPTEEVYGHFRLLVP